MNTKTKEQIQEEQYEFPYHYLSHERNGAIYIFRHLFWGLEHYTYIQYVINLLVDLSPKTLLDVGCGEGRLLRDVLSRDKEKAIDLYGTDYSNAAIKLAKAFNPDISFGVHNILESATSDKYTMAVSCEVIEHIKPDMIDNYCKYIAGSLTDNGVFVLTTPTTNIPTSKKHYQHFTKESLEAHLSPYFVIEEVVYLNVVNWRSKLLNRLIANRFYLSNFAPLNRFVLSSYRTKLLVGNKQTGSRILIRARKR